MDHPAVRRILDGRGVERLLSTKPRRRPDGALGRLRPRDPPGLRLRPSPGRRRRRQGGSRHRLGRGHEDPLRRHPPRQDVGVDDDERCGPAVPRRLHRRCRGTGRRPVGAERNHPERHPQGVHGPQHLHLSAGAEHADRVRHHRLHGRAHASLQLDLDLGLPHAGSRGDGGAGVGLHHRRRPRVRPHRRGQRPRRRCVRTASELLLRDRDELLHGGRQAARRPQAVGEGHEPVRAGRPQVTHAADALPDQRRVAHRTRPLQQRGPNRSRGDGGRARRHAEPPHQLLRRSARPPDRLQRTDCARTPS